MNRWGIVLVVAACSVAGAGPLLDKKDFTTWPRADVLPFGCFLEKEFGYKDPRFNCTLKTYRNRGDPCKQTKEYYEGPAFPPDQVALVDPRFKVIQLAWEHGQLQNVSIELKKKYTEPELRKLFKLPAEASIQQCGKETTCILLTGFDHMGAGDVDCR